MNNSETSLVKGSLFNVINNQHCPQCSSQMKESDRRKEGSITYVWFDCVSANCDGQWMQPYTSLQADLSKLGHKEEVRHEVINVRPS